MVKGNAETPEETEGARSALELAAVAHLEVRESGRWSRGSGLLLPPSRSRTLQNRRWSYSGIPVMQETLRGCAG